MKCFNLEISNKKKVFKDMLIWARSFFPENNWKNNETTKPPFPWIITSGRDYIIFPQKIRRLQVVLPQAQATDNGREEKVVDTWFAGFDNILDDFIIVPKKTKSDDGERNAWVIAPVYHEATKSTSFVVLDASNLSNGPVCEAHLDDHHVPWALHGTWWSN